MELALSLRDVSLHFQAKAKSQEIRAVDRVSFDLKAGETLGLVGESGCGKSSLARCIVRYYRPTEGEIFLFGEDISRLNEKALRPYRPLMQMIFQDPYSSLNPRMNIFDCIAEPLRTHQVFSTREGVRQRVCELMHQVGLDPRFLYKYPHEFSGGQRQRVAIARALALNPQVLICDEPISALDVSIQAQILNLLARLKRELNLSLVFIAHDLAAVKYIADRIAVMYLGQMVEEQETQQLFANPRHPYTRMLLNSIPIADPTIEKRRHASLLSGEVPSQRRLPRGCRFQGRCPHAQAICREEAPELTVSAEGAAVRCHLADELEYFTLQSSV